MDMSGMVDRLGYCLQELRTNGARPEWWRIRLLDHVNGRVQEAVHGGEGIDVMAADWDTLIVLDACRADVFEQTWPPSEFDDYRRATSQGSWTVEWATNNFDDEYGDTVYTTANPLISKHVGDRWHDLIEVWDDSFDPSVQTVRPESVVEAAIDAHEQYPNKRHIVHFVQPHAPYIDAADAQIGSSWHGVDSWGADDDGGYADVWDAVRAGAVDPGTVIEAYRQNTELLRTPLDRLLDSIGGKVVLTADHGEVFGQRSWPIPFQMWGHPPQQRVHGLVEVPWAEVATGPRRRIIGGAVASASQQQDMAAQLEALGYR